MAKNDKTGDAAPQPEGTAPATPPQPAPAPAPAQAPTPAPAPAPAQPAAPGELRLELASGVVQWFAPQGADVQFRLDVTRDWKEAGQIKEADGYLTARYASPVQGAPAAIARKRVRVMISAISEG